MLHKLVGKVLFPRAPAWQQKQLATTTVWVLTTALVFAALFGAAIYWLNSKRN